MIGKLSIGIALATCIAVSQLAFAPAASAKSLKVKVDSVKTGGTIPDQIWHLHAGRAGPRRPLVADISPPYSWSKGPRGTKSYAIVLTDSDNSPKENRDKMNKEGMTVTPSAKRRTFSTGPCRYPAQCHSAEGRRESERRVVHGKPATTKLGVRGLNISPTSWRIMSR